MVYVTDFNDEFPTFDFEMYRTDICHSQLVDEVFVQPVAIDRDSGANSQLTYSLQDVSTSSPSSTSLLPLSRRTN